MMLGEKQQFSITIEDPEKARLAANVAALFLAALVFVRGFHAHAGVAFLMAVFISTSARTLLEILIHWNAESASGGYAQAA